MDTPVDLMLEATIRTDYKMNFWEAMKFNYGAEARICDMVGGDHSMYMPMTSEAVLRQKANENGSIRGLASTIKAYSTTSSAIWAYDTEDRLEFVSANAPIPGLLDADEFTKFRTMGYRAAGIMKVTTEFLMDPFCDVEDYLIKRLAKTVASTEDRAFINGSGEDEPTGLLHATEGAMTAKVVPSVSYDDCIDLFFSVKPEYRTNSVWIMNDSTALSLRKLKDEDGNYLWNHNTDRILGKRVVICNDMPDAEPGKKPILFGDLSYYWIVDRTPVCVKPLKELFAVDGKVGFSVQELLDARLIRPEAVKVIEIEAAVEEPEETEEVQ